MPDSGGGGNNAQTVKTNSAPWKEQEPYLKSALQRAESLYNSPGPQFFPGSTVAGFSPTQQQAQQLGIQRATGGNQTMGASEDYARRAIGGDFLNSGDQNGMVFQNIQSKIMPAVNSQFSSAGRYGSGLHADTATRAMTEAYAPIAMDNFQRERQMQQDMAQYAPQYAADDWQNIAAMDAIGGQQQQLAQSELDDAVARWSYNADLPYNKLAQYVGLIGGNWGGQTTSQQPYNQPSLLSQLGGLGMMGAGLFL